jgi:hypothetical protein
MLTIITPCCRQANIPKLYDSIMFDKIHQWIIIYDTTKGRKYDKIYANDPKIMEVECADAGCSGNSQRNYGLKLVTDGFIYFLDDDNIIHPDFWTLADTFNPAYFYTFNQLRNKKGQILNGNNIARCHIDTAMFVLHKQHIGDIVWRTNEYTADGYFICDVAAAPANKGKHQFLNVVACYYNFLIT